jgi:hypothetical protein
MLDPIITTRPTNRPLAHREDHRVALAQRHHLGAGLPPRPLLGEDEFAAREGRRARQKYRDLQREDGFAVHVLMQAIVIAATVAEDERGRAPLAGRVTLDDKVRMAIGVARG